MDRVLWMALIWTTSAKVYASEEYYYQPFNVTRITPSGIAAYRSALTLDWLAAEDTRQRELVAAFESEPGPPAKFLATDCISYPRPTAGKVARLMLELLKNLEGDEGSLVTDLIHTLIRCKLLVLETSMFESEPDLDSLVKTPAVMMGEPHVTFPRILAMVWMTVTDASTLKLHGWCTINKVNKYLTAAKSSDVAKNLRALEPIVARARFIMEEFILHVTPLNMLTKTSTTERQVQKPLMDNLMADIVNPKSKRPVRKHQGMVVADSNLFQEGVNKVPVIIYNVTQKSSSHVPLHLLASEGDIFLSSASWRAVPQMCKFLLSILFILFCY